LRGGVLWGAMPALLTTRSGRRKVPTVFLNRAMLASSLVRSAGSGSASPPLALMPAATSSSSSVRRATSTVFAPSAANSSAMPRPMPLLAPVTIAILPWSCPAILYSRSRKRHYSRKARYGHKRLFGWRPVVAREQLWDNVCFTPKSGHCLSVSEYPLCANSGHGERNEISAFPFASCRRGLAFSCCRRRPPAPAAHNLGGIQCDDSGSANRREK